LFFRLALPFSDNYFSKFGRANHFSRLTCLHKIFYSLFLGVTANTLRNWEKEKKLKVCRNPQNKYRLYIKEELEQLLQSINPS